MSAIVLLAAILASQPMQIVSEDVSFVAGGRTIPGTLVHPASGKGPGLLLLAGADRPIAIGTVPCCPGRTEVPSCWPKRWPRAA